MPAFTFTPVSSCTPVPAGDVRNALLASPKVSTILADDLTDKLTTARRQHLDSLRGCATAVDAWELVKPQAAARHRV